jgi:endogenous inhibitor of DNA gyrase (YacG/DUF329 family)
MQRTPSKAVSCPSCQQPVEWVEANVHRPFCSERCKLIDFGEWASEKHTIPGNPVFAEADEDYEPLQ